MEFLERLEGSGNEERWLVQVGDGLPHVAWFLHDDDREWLRQTERESHAWRGAIHPRVTQILSIGWHGDRVVFEIEDDRGPLLATAAQQLTDPNERERWVISQFIALGDGLATLRRRDAAFAHRQLEPEKMYVDVQGHARLRAPIPHVLQGPRPMRMGAGIVKGRSSFMAPEQARGSRGTVASDVFALASNLYFALSGRTPFDNNGNVMAELMAIISDPPAPLVLQTPGLSRVLDRAFAKAVDARTPDPGTFAGELWQCVPDATDYDEVLSDRIVTWRANAASEPSRRLLLEGPTCRMKWEHLAPTTADDVRHCASCKQDVVRIRSIAAVVPLLGQHCVSYTGGD